MTKNIMVLGTASSVGKSMVTAALCRIFTEDGYRVAPFKSQNMALNSFITKDGGEMGRAQVVQAQACGLEPSVLMNPVLLKPSTDTKAQVIINGKVHSNKSAVEYHQFKPQVKGIVKEAYDKLAEDRDIIVIEGAGSPAEINLRDKDIVNMGMAEMVDAPVLLVGDIDRGGVFASIVGTIVLLSEEEKKRVKGLIINKFRGDVNILKPGIDQLEEITGIPVVGVIPHMKIMLEDEDSVSERLEQREKTGEIDICVLKNPRLSNYTDFDVFDLFPDVGLRYATTAEEIGEPDLIILPGSKNTIEDLSYIKASGMNMMISMLHEKGKAIVGICGGFQMLGEKIEDPDGVEGKPGAQAYGLGLTEMRTVMDKEKVTTQVKGKIINGNHLLKGLEGYEISGYEIHMGKSTGIEEEDSLTITENGKGGISSPNIMGTYIHGIFDNTEFTRKFLNNIREKKGLPPIETDTTIEEHREREFSKLSAITRENLNMDIIYKILEEK